MIRHWNHMQASMCDCNAYLQRKLPQWNGVYGIKWGSTILVFHQANGSLNLILVSFPPLNLSLPLFLYVCVSPYIHREFQTPYLLCDCNLLWLLRWIKDRNIAVKNTKCSYPQSLQGQLITSIRLELLTCGKDTQTWPKNMHTYEHRFDTAQRCHLKIVVVLTLFQSFQWHNICVICLVSDILKDKISHVELWHRL